MPRYHVFLSHAGADKPAVEHLAHKLQEVGLEPFLDRWHLIPGEPWQEALEEALDQSSTCAVFIGKEVGPWQNEEMRVALEARVRDGGFRVIPVLLPGGRKPGKEKLPRFLRRLTWVDFRSGIDNEDTFRHLVAGIQGRPPGPGAGGGARPLSDGYRCMAPAREPFVDRSEYSTVRDALLLEDASTVGITTAIHGAGGFGKTALAIELCHDAQVRKRYPDGILWTTLGEEIDAAGRLARVRDLIRWWTEEDPPAFETVSAASAHLREELAGKRVLLVVDDVWRPEDVTPFQGLGPRAALLVTTRDSRTLPAEAVRVHVDAMEVPEAVRLLGDGLPAGREADLQKLATRLGEWPLLLKIVHRQLRELTQRDSLSLEQALREVNEALDAEGLTVFDREDLESRSQAVGRTVGASLRRLFEEEVGCFEQLAIFPEDKDIPLPVLEKLWGLGSFAAKKLCGRLYDLSLLLRFDRASVTIRLHDVIRAYLLKKGERHLAEWHRRLLDAFRPSSGRWPDLPREESYLWIYLFHHLSGAGDSDVGRNLLFDLQYVQSKLESTGINALLADCSYFVENEQEIRLVRDALRLSAHVLERHPIELAGQLRARLLDRQEAGIRELLEQRIDSGTAWIRPRTASLPRPGGALIRSIDHPGLPAALAVLSRGRVVSGSFDGFLRVWDVERGQTLQTIEGHSSGVSAMAMLDSRRLVSGFSDGTLQVWDLENGQTLQTFGEHSSRINSVAGLGSRHVLFGSDDGRLRLWNLEKSQTVQIFEGHSSKVRAVAVLDSRRVVSGSADRTLRVWDTETCQTLQILAGHSDWVNVVAVLDKRRVISGSDDQTLRLWDVESGQSLQIFEGHSDWVSAVAVLDKGRIVSASWDGTLRVWNIRSGQAVQIFEGHSSRVSAVAVLDNRRVISGSDDRTLRVWDIESGQTSQIFDGHSSWVRAMTMFGSRRVVSGSDSGILRVWDVELGQTLQTLEGHSKGVTAVAVMDSRRVVSGSDDGTLRVWDLESSRTLKTLKGHYSIVSSVAVLDSCRVVSGSSDRTLRVWNVESGAMECLFTLEAPVMVVAVVPDLRIIIAGDSSGRVHFFDFVEP